MKKMILFAVILLSVLLYSSCNVTRVVKTEAATYQRGDTAVHITVRTIETYDASKKVY